MSRIANQWKDYTCFDAGNGEKLEQWKGIVLRRPDPLASKSEYKSLARYRCHLPPL